MSSSSNIGKTTFNLSTANLNKQQDTQTISKKTIPDSNHKVTSHGTTSKAGETVAHATSLTSTVTAGIFKEHLERKQEVFKNSKEYKELKEKFIKIAEKDFNKIYSSNFQGKNDKVRDAFIEKHAEKLMESFLKNIDLKTGHEAASELHASWEELLTSMFPKNFDFKTLDEKHPFGESGIKQVQIKSTQTDITFIEKNGKLSAKVGDRTFTTNDTGIIGILKLQSKIHMSQGKWEDADKKTQSKCHKIALESLQNGTINKGLLGSAGEAIAKGESYSLFTSVQSVIQETVNFGDVEFLESNSDTLTHSGAAAGSVGIEFGTLTIAQGIAQLHEALKIGISDHEFLNLYKQFETQFEANNPKLSDTDRFNLKEIEQVAKTMRDYSKVQSLSTSGVLNVLLGASSILGGAGTIAQVSTLAASSTGVGGGLLIVSGGVEMAKACKKLRKIEQRETAIENTENKFNKDKKTTDYETGLVRSFLEIQADMIDNEKTKEHLNLTGGGGMVCGGGLLVAATIAGTAGSVGFGAGAAVVLGGVAIGYVAGQGYLLYKDHKIEQLQTKLLSQDIAQVRSAQEQGVENPFINMRSTAGKLMEVYQAVNAEQANKSANKPMPLTDHLVQQYMGIHPEQFLSIMKDMDANFMASLKDENVVSTGMFIKNEGLAQAAKSKASNVKNAGIASGYTINAALAGLVGSKETKKSLLETAEVKTAQIEVQNELKAMKSALKGQEQVVAKQTEIKEKQSNALTTLMSDIATSSKTLVEIESKVNSQQKTEMSVKTKMSEAVIATKNVLTEASSLASRKKPVWEENVNVEYQIRDALGAVEKEITYFEGQLYFTLNNNNITNRVETYNNLQQQFELLKTIKKEGTVAVKTLENVVRNLREENRASHAIKHGNEKLNAMNSQYQEISSKRISELTKEKLNAKRKSK